MRTKLIQKQFFKGTREYEIDGEQVFIRVKTRGKQEVQSVMLAVLEPDPVITRSHLEFISRVNGEPLLSLLLSRPNVSEFNDFVNTLKQCAQAEYNTYSGINVASQSTSANSIAEHPPEFNEHSTADIIKSKTVNIDALENAITMLQTYVDSRDVEPLIDALEALKLSPKDHTKLVNVANIFNELGACQGAVLTYAPYISLMLSDDPFASN